MKNPIKILIVIILLTCAGANHAADISEIDYSDPEATAEYSRADELSYHGFVLIEVVAVAKTCWSEYGAPAGKNPAKNLKGIMEICKNALERDGMAYHPHAKTLPGEELNCFYLDVLEEMCFTDGSYEPQLSWSVYCKELRRIHREYFGTSHLPKYKPSSADRKKP